MPLQVRRVLIIEEEDGWTVVRGLTDRITYPSALEALMSVQAEDKEQPAGRVTIIEWTATTRLGRCVLAVIVPEGGVK